MANTISSWAQVSEAIASGREVAVDPVTGKKYKVTYRVQSSTKFIVKAINEIDLINNGVLTPNGIKALTAYFNAESAFVSTVGKLDNAFFENKFIVYTVLKDGEILGRTKQKIQFSVEPRKNSDGVSLYPSLKPEQWFVDAKSFSTLTKLAPQILTILTNTANSTELPDPTPEGTEATPAENTETKSDVGKKFLYTMRTNSKLYMMTFVEGGNLSAKTEDNSDPNGTVSYDSENHKVLWNTTLDDSESRDSKIKTAVKAPLFHDTEIVNGQDKSFLEKIFTDESFRNKIISEYEAEYAETELTPENLRKILFYKDGKSIFGTSTESGETTTPEAEPDDMMKQINAVTAELKGAVDATSKK